MKTKRILTALTALFLLFSLAACGTDKGGGKNDERKAEIAALIAKEPGTQEEAADLHRKLMEQENAILSENSALWEKVFLSANKGSIMIEDGSNYGDFLLKTIDGAKKQFKADELKLLKDGAELIRRIEVKLTALENKFPGCGKKPSDGNEVKSGTLFAGNTVTVVNFWFTTCSPCVGELADLDALNKLLAEKGGAVIGINSFTLDGDKTAINDAKDILTKKGVSYKNIWFDSKSEAGKFTSGLFSYPTTYVVDKNGNIVGDPIVGAITGKKQAEALEKLIDQAIANSKG